ncbi:MAG: aspartate aminotransferase family protein [Phycisphaerales bacterium]|nr:aspartate aminotransferase family protein [Phycisphaerae bacterium]NNF42617.1 aspartate aminotransferase family protein [Phycisphaerales bacterium]NNM24649.1 aspartate aminotransferase family protein [Phycisphaerales bacterium]
MASSESLRTRRAAVVAKAVPQVTTATVASARDAMLVDLDGRTVIDFAGGIGVMNVGHGNKAVVAAIQDQADRLLHTCIHVATYEPYVALCEKLVELFPHGRKTKALLLNSGAEAVENAIKIARQATARPAVLCFSEGFHGRTLLCASLTSKTGYKRGCGPFAPEIYRLPFPSHERFGDGLELDAFVQRELDRLQEAFTTTVSALDVAAIIIEVIQGEGGFVTAPAAYLRGLRKICDEHGIMLIFDEVQSGFCRTGRWAAYQHFDVLPDLSTWAKSMGGGMPISAVLGRAEVVDMAAPGTLGGTFGGNPVSCAAALATISEMERLSLNDRAEHIGRRIRERFEALQRKLPAISDVRGLGAMMAVELRTPRGAPATDLVREVVSACVERGVLVIAAGPYANILRILCPLVIEDELLDKGLDIVEGELVRCAATAGPTHSAAAPTGARS